MTQYNTINELVSATKKRIYDLNSIIDVLLTGYRTASDVIDPNMDHRQTYIDQLQELEKDLSAIVEVHPAHKTEKLTQEVYRDLAAIAGQL
jgi:pyoverdine/dityrosine biosynthesis protein Dit1